MNIFYLDTDAANCAAYHVDKHVVKMTVESTQILCSAYYFTGEGNCSPYKLTHGNHPCCVWARTSLSNWLWLKSLALALCAEYTYRYGRIHKCEAIIRSLKTPALCNKGFTEVACVMDERYKISGDAVENYRNYYRYGKRNLWSWTGRGQPDWLLQEQSP